MVDVAEARRARVVDRSPKGGKIDLIFKGDSKVRTVANSKESKRFGEW